MPKLELFYFNECPYCQIVLKAIKESGMTSKIDLLNTRENSSHRDRLLKVTSKTQVPCLFIDGKPMFESKDIAHWIKQESQSK